VRGRRCDGGIQARASRRLIRPVFSAGRTGPDLLSSDISGLPRQFGSWHSRGHAPCSFARCARATRRGVERRRVMVQLPTEVEAGRMTILRTPMTHGYSVTSRQDDHLCVRRHRTSSRQWLSWTTCSSYAGCSSCSRAAWRWPCTDRCPRATPAHARRCCCAPSGARAVYADVHV
jgi:hypothetical protein